jgi:hypothetical protein
MGSIKGHQALDAVREPLGPFNWAMFRPSEGAAHLDFVNAGSLVRAPRRRGRDARAGAAGDDGGLRGEQPQGERRWTHSCRCAS